MNPKRRGMIDSSRRFVLQDLQNECCWYFSADEVQAGFFRIDCFKKDLENLESKKITGKWAQSYIERPKAGD